MKSLQLSKPHFLIVIGAPRSGKSEFASRFADTFNAPYISAAAFHHPDASSAQTSEIVDYVLREVFKTQQTILYEGLGGSRAERTAASKLAKEHGYEPLIIWVQTDLNVARSRAIKRSRSNRYPMSVEEFEQAVRRFTAPNTSEDYVVISGLHTYASQAKAVLRRLSAARERSVSTVERPSGRSRSEQRPIQIQ